MQQRAVLWLTRALPTKHIDEPTGIQEVSFRPSRILRNDTRTCNWSVEMWPLAKGLVPLYARTTDTIDRNNVVGIVAPAFAGAAPDLSSAGPSPRPDN